MSQPAPTSPNDRTVAVLRRLVTEARDLTDEPSIDVEPDLDEPLTAYVDSMVLATLIELIEAEWDLELDDDDIDPDNFATLRALAHLLDQR